MALTSEKVCNAGFEGSFWADDRQRHFLALCKVEHSPWGGQVDRQIAPEFGRSWVSWSGQDLGFAGVKAEPPGQGMFPPTRPQNQYFHGEILS